MKSAGKDKDSDQFFSCEDVTSEPWKTQQKTSQGKRIATSLTYRKQKGIGIQHT